jgi:hypothetical protein
MRRIFPLLGILLLIGGISANSQVKSDTDQSPAGSCESDMAAETAAYIQSNGITLTGNYAQYFSNSTSRVYLRSSEEIVNLRDQTSFTNTFAVIEVKGPTGNGVFYTVQQVITPSHITFVVKQNQQPVKTVAVIRKSGEGVGPTPTQPWPPVSNRCWDLRFNYLRLYAAALEMANSTCTIQFFSAEVCLSLDALETKSVFFKVRPTSSACFTYSNSTGGADTLWLAVSADPLVHEALDIAIWRQFSQYRTTY